MVDCFVIELNQNHEQQLNFVMQLGDLNSVLFGKFCILCDVVFTVKFDSCF
jgi:hypothetical protein